MNSLTNHLNQVIILKNLSFLFLILCFQSYAQEKDSLFIVLSDSILSYSILTTGEYKSTQIINIDEIRNHPYFEMNVFSDSLTHNWQKQYNESLKTGESKKGLNLNFLKLKHYNLVNGNELFKWENWNNLDSLLAEKDVDTLSKKRVKAYFNNCKKFPTSKILIARDSIAKKDTLILKQNQIGFGSDKVDLIFNILNYKHIFINLEGIKDENIFYEVKWDDKCNDFLYEINREIVKARNR